MSFEGNQASRGGEAVYTVMMLAHVLMLHILTCIQIVEA